MLKSILSSVLLFYSFDLLAQSQLPTSQDTVKTKKISAITAEGAKTGRTNLIIQNSSSGNKEEDSNYKIDQLQAEAISKTNQDSIFKQRQFELGAEILPYLAPWINETAKPCMEIIIPGEKDALKKSADCTAKAIRAFKSNPTEFLSRLPASDRAKLEAITQEKIKSSITPEARHAP